MITITEALAEIKLLDKKIENKITKVLNHLYRLETQLDPLGDSKKALEEELQSITDLRRRWTGLRGGIATANLANKITIEGEERTIFEWLTWKREIATREIHMHQQIHQLAKKKMDELNARPALYKTAADAEVKVDKLVLNVDYAHHIKKAEELQTKLDKLDGQLSLKNATISFEV